MKEMEKKVKEKLIKLLQENGDLEIVCCVDTGVVQSDDYAWWSGKLANASLESIYNSDERMYLKSEDEEELIEECYQELNNDDKKSDEELWALAEKKVQDLEWKEVILLSIIE